MNLSRSNCTFLEQLATSVHLLDGQARKNCVLNLVVDLLCVLSDFLAETAYQHDRRVEDFLKKAALQDGFAVVLDDVED